MNARDCLILWHVIPSGSHLISLGCESASHVHKILMIIVGFAVLF